jgi:hypothetical protein
MKIFLVDFLKGLAHIFYHIVVVALSAAFVLSLPFTTAFLARNILKYWSFIGNDKVFLISVEMVLAIFFVLFSYYVRRSWKDRRLSNVARATGLVYMTPTHGLFARKRIKRLKERQGIARDVMIVGSTGFRTFVDPRGELHHVIQNCREARIMLLNPDSEGATVRAKSILNPDITPESLGEQIRESIHFLKQLKAVQKNIQLKLYPDTPFLKLSILGDYLWVQHYHAGLDVQMMPKFVFKHDQNPGSLYVPFYEYFFVRWNHPDIPEYDLDTDELVYRDSAGNELRREKFYQTESFRKLDLDNYGQGEKGLASCLGA